MEIILKAAINFSFSHWASESDRSITVAIKPVELKTGGDYYARGLAIMGCDDMHRVKVLPVILPSRS
jgi:hypothetical protein